ncbi:hypothetical protein KIH77_09110 [Bifidobacterium sp. 82T24]|uniref:SpaA isopeptide-forming pilin-related protein n=1 Tax=Bifidobacterium pluvialisilvae TaxID=2834436 RepID=UPI001C59AA63|nr:SpaA isopeptide-forming pilin-related protein [Bifidobacterium pluvialisilvae]MBW3088878.1 hypothetical protein [Bifidobacterium pluvialisilvae]
MTVNNTNNGSAKQGGRASARLRAMKTFSGLSRLHGVRSVAAVIAAVSMLGVGVPAASAADAVTSPTPTTSTTSPTPASTPSSDTTDAGRTSNATAVPKSAAGRAAAIPTAVGDCAAVTSWTELETCIADARADAATAVVITKPVTADAGKTITIDAGKTIAITSTVGAADGKALTTAAGDTAGSLFDVKSGGALAFGTKDKNDSFTYGGAEATPATRRLATVESDAKLDLNGGTYDNIVVSDNTGTFDQDTTAAIATNRGGTVTVESGLFQNNNTTGTRFYSGLFNQSAGGLTINGGTFKNNKGTRGSVISVPAVDEATAIAIHGGTFDGNTTSYAGGVIMQNSAKTTTTIDGSAKFTGNTAGTVGGVICNNGTLTIKAGTFGGDTAAEGNTSKISQAENPNENWKKGGGVISNTGTLTISGGSFKNNTAESVGGVINNTHTLTITGGLFDSNVAKGLGGGAIAQNGESGTPTMEITGASKNAVRFLNNRQGSGGCDTESEDCMGRSGSGGGAIHANYGGSLVIQGGVTFQGNHADSWNWSSGGGAVWSHANLWVKNGLDGTKPQFIGNWAAVSDTAKIASSADQKASGDQIARGGAGGAIFLQGARDEKNKAYFMGGDYKDNVSGYLGGAIYTEEYTTSYIGKTVATQNTAGHFGGGLWFCPSGASTTSEGGNIALYGNSVDDGIDANTDNKSTAGTSDTMAGDDLAIMNPYFKNTAYSANLPPNYFMLLNTWFTSRTTQTVDWYHDGTPAQTSSGYYDAWLPKQKVQQGRDAVLSGGKRYPSDSKAIANRTKLMLYQDNRADHQNALAQAQADAVAGGYTLDHYTTGVALKSVLNADGKALAGSTGTNGSLMRNALLTVTGNSARLSGGGFGSNGVIVFDSPYSVSWSKAATKSGDATKVDTTKLLPGSKWKVTTTDGGALDESLRPADCQANADAETCWHTHDNGATKEVVIQDNGSRDNNPADGEISIDNLKAGTYTLTEEEAPSGYQPTGNEYTFTIKEVDPGEPPVEAKVTLKGQAVDENGPIENGVIGNVRKTGSVDWSKRNATDPVKYLAGSHWKITDADGNTIAGYDDITDCDVAAGDNCPSTTKDEDKSAGHFTVKGLPVDAEYRLVETRAPDGYLQPGAGAYYRFSIDGNGVTTWRDAAGNRMASSEIRNSPIRFSWTKVDSADHDEELEGSVWSVKRVANADGTAIDNPVAKTVKDCTTAECAKVSNTATTYTDVNEEPGRFTIAELEPGQYEMTEQTAPDGYVKSAGAYKFTITSTTTDAGDGGHAAVLDCSAVTDGRKLCVTDNKVNKIANVRAVASLPLTGGSAMDWLMVGGGLALAAAAIGFGVNEYRKRRTALMM